MASPASPLTSDRRLMGRVSRGDERAWAIIDARYRPRLARYVASLAPPGALDAEDVVQDALLKAYRGLAAGRRPADRLGPWIYRIARNTAIDALRSSARRPDPHDGAADAPDLRREPERVTIGRERLRGVVSDVAALPERQRVAFLARVVDDRPVEDVAEELGLSANALHMTVMRARESLVRAERARDAACEEIRPLLHAAHDRGARPPEPARLHLRGCPGCREYRTALRRVDRRARGLTPPPAWLFGLAAAAPGAGLKGAVATGVGVSALVAGGLVLGGVHESRAGSPSPFRIPGAREFGTTTVRAGDPVPRRTTLVHARVDVPASADERHPRFVTLRCPAGTIVGGLATPEQRTDVNANPRPAILDRRDTAVRWQLLRMGSSGVGTATIGVVCRRPDANGSIVRRPRRAAAGERPAHVCVLGTTAERRARGIPVENELVARPGGATVGRVMDGQPLSVLRADRGGRWLRVVADDAQLRGWISSRLVC
jgi:RNA polymerase sigma factor (sigma-70 family)